MQIKETIKRQKAEINYFESTAETHFEKRINKPYGWPLITQFNCFRKFNIINLFIKRNFYKIGKKKIFINIGSGSGMEAYFLLKKNPHLRIIAIDLSRINCLYTLTRSKRYNFNQNISIVCADGTKLPLRENIANFAYFYESLHHIPNYKKALNEINYSLKKYGIIILVEPFISKAINIFFTQLLKRERKEYMGISTHNFIFNEFKSKLLKINYNIIFFKKIWDYYPNFLTRLIDYNKNFFKIFRIFNKFLNLLSNVFLYNNAILLFHKAH